MADEIMDIRNAAKYLQIKERTLYRLVGEGEIPGIKVGGQWRFSRQCLDEMFRNRIEVTSPMETMKS